MRRTPKPVRRAATALARGDRGALARLLRRRPGLWTDEALDLWPSALAHPEVDFLPCLLALGGDPDARDFQGNTPLMHLSARRRRRNLARARSLLAAGARIDAQNDRGETALSYAASANFGSMVALLLEAGADPRVGDLVAPETARGWAGPAVQRLLESRLTAEELARLPAAWRERWCEVSTDPRDPEQVDRLESDGTWSWRESPLLDRVWVGEWPPPDGIATPT